VPRRAHNARWGTRRGEIGWLDRHRRGGVIESPAPGITFVGGQARVREYRKVG
jgi:hypothetical protein